MSLYDYELSRELEAQDVPFHALIMAAMRRAGTDNLQALQAAFPATWAELQARYVAPGGILPSELAGESAATPIAPGDQIAYVPLHAGGDLNHLDVELGFVASVRPDGEAAFCRYWRRGQPGTLRTVANSECTPVNMLVRHESVPQAIVEGILQMIWVTS